MIALGGATIARVAATSICVAAIVGCAGVVFEQDYPDSATTRDPPTYNSDGSRETIFGSGGFDLLNTFGSGAKDAGGGGIGVNGFLWRATLDTVSFMPLSSADPFGGVIITDWYTPPETPGERFKMNIFILGRQLRADGLRVAVFRQAHAGDGNWITASVKAQTSISLEDQILTRARQLRVAAATAK